MKNRKKNVQVKAELSIEEVARLDKIIEKYNFKSRYQVVQFVVNRFLKVADPVIEEDSIDEEIIKMLSNFADSDKAGSDNDTVKSGTTINTKSRKPKAINHKIKSYTDRYILENYTNLEDKFRLFASNIREKAVDSLDILNDTMILLYETEEKFNCYNDFKEYADKKFTPKVNR